MGNSSGPIPILLIEDSETEPKIMEKKENEAPLHKREVQTLHSAADKGPRIGQITPFEEITRTYKKEGHVEGVYKIGYQFRGLGMAYHHQDNRQPFRYGYY